MCAEVRSADTDISQGSWSANAPSTMRSIRALFKKSFLTKVRRPAFVVEFIVALGIYLVLKPIYDASYDPYPGTSNPGVWSTTVGYDLFSFLEENGNATLVAMPNTTNMRNLVNLSFYSYAHQAGINYTFTFNFVDTVDEMENLIYATDFNGMGLNWVNSEASDNLLSPVFNLYVNALSNSPYDDIYYILRSSVAAQLGNTQIAAISIQNQQFASTNVTLYTSLQLAFAVIAVFPVVFATMPEIQTILEEKDTKVISLAILMGCPESAYWFVSFMVPFILAVFPYIGLCACFCYWFGMVGSDFSLLFVVSLLFIISHIMCLFFITTLIKKASNGRIITVVMIVLSIFFGELHYRYTLSTSNTSPVAKHVTSLIPLSAYQLFLISLDTQIMDTNEPMGWKDVNVDITYPPSYGLLYLAGDSILYFLLFCLLNATAKREFGSPPFTWRELFSSAAWRRVFCKDSSKVYNQSDDIIEVHNVSKVYHGFGEIQALSGVEFSIKGGENIVIIGPNGAGKSTLLNILTGAIEPTTGNIRLMGGEETDRFMEVQKYLGVCFQDNVLIGLLSVREHFEIFGAFRGVPLQKLEETMNAFTDALQLNNMLDNRAADLSGGQKRKLCISLSLLGSPPIVVMDEPTAGVDVQARQVIWKTIAALKETTTIVTSHALEEAEAVCTRMFIVSRGKLAFNGTSTALRKEYKCGYVLRVQMEDGSDIDKVVNFVKEHSPEAKVMEGRGESISIPVNDRVPAMIKEFEQRKAELGVKVFSFSIENLEDTLIRMIQAEEPQFEINHK